MDNIFSSHASTWEWKIFPFHVAENEGEATLRQNLSDMLTHEEMED